MNILYWILKIIVYIPLTILFPTIVVGRKNIGKGKAILLCNHQSNLDPILLSLKIVKRPNILAKKELFDNKFSSAFFSSLGAIAVDRKNVGLTTIKNVLKVLKNEERLIIFPEGTRKKISLEDADSLKNGASLFALKSGAKIIPMYFVKKPKLFCFNKMIIGEPIFLTEFQGAKSSKENIAQVSEIIKQAMLNLKLKSLNNSPLNCQFEIANPELETQKYIEYFEDESPQKQTLQKMLCDFFDCELSLLSQKTKDEKTTILQQQLSNKIEKEQKNLDIQLKRYERIWQKNDEKIFNTLSQVFENLQYKNCNFTIALTPVQPFSQNSISNQISIYYKTSPKIALTNIVKGIFEYYWQTRVNEVLSQSVQNCENYKLLAYIQFIISYSIMLENSAIKSIATGIILPECQIEDKNMVDVLKQLYRENLLEDYILKSWNCIYQNQKELINIFF